MGWDGVRVCLLYEKKLSLLGRVGRWGYDFM